MLTEKYSVFTLRNWKQRAFPYVVISAVCLNKRNSKSLYCLRCYLIPRWTDQLCEYIEDKNRPTLAIQKHVKLRETPAETDKAEQHTRYVIGVRPGTWALEFARDSKFCIYTQKQYLGKWKHKPNFYFSKEKA